MSSINPTPLSAPPRPSSSRSVAPSIAPSISGSTLCDYPITTGGGGNISAFGSRNDNWPALLLGDLQFTAAETNFVDVHGSNAGATSSSTTTYSNNTNTAELRGGDRDRDHRHHYYGGDRDHFRPLTSTNTNTSIAASNGSSNYSQNSYSNNSGSSASNSIFATAGRTRSHTSSRSASTGGRSSTSTNRPYIVGGGNPSSNQHASSSVYSLSAQHPRGIPSNGIGLGIGTTTTTTNRHAPSTGAAQGLPNHSATSITTCTSTHTHSSSSSSSTTARASSGSGHKRHSSMVTLEQMQTSNAHIVSSLPPGLVAVFVGATRGIGESTLKQFVRYAVAPRVYFVGRDRKDGDRVSAELACINPEGEYHFVGADVSLLANVDEVCRGIKTKERVVNLLFLSCGTRITGKETKESLYYLSAVTFYARIRFIVNLLPELQKSTSLRRVVSVYNGTKEGPIDTSDFQCRNLSMLAARSHSSSMMTLALESLALEAPDVSFVHTFPGLVRTQLGKDTKSAGITVLRAVFKVVGPKGGRDVEETSGVSLGFGSAFTETLNTGNTEGATRPSIEIRPTASGSVLSAAPSSTTSPSSPSNSSTSTSSPSTIRDSSSSTRNSHSSHSTHSSSHTNTNTTHPTLKVARGTDGKEGSGVYSVNYDGETLSSKTVEQLRVMREEGDMVRKVWEHVEGEFRRVVGCSFVV
ncbi:hypothetical protein B0T20DRAFT_495820 [Sordaria brevicollis]|uniref:Uncharacterized protein n=1 Tax=Sordaria brevicollis TaxID=83679 RepID=A0AAE0PGW0_SORBR|nr:hypothetical protein B0T20DRAFT_495820 [Sordaria brevicollis]